MSNLKISKSFPVGAAAVTQYQLVKTPAAVVVSAAATDDCLGIVENGYDASATEASVCIWGVTRAIASAAIAKGAYLMPAASGRVVTHDGLSTNPAIGTALEAATAAGDEIAIVLGVYLGGGPAA